MVAPVPPADAVMFFEFMKEPAILFLLALSGVAGLISGKQESDDAKAGKPNADPTMINETVWDWAVDAGCGVIGGMIGLGLIMSMPIIPIYALPAFGFAGRKVLSKFGAKVENSIDMQK